MIRMPYGYSAAMPALALVCTGIVCLCAAPCEPNPGRHSWFHGLSGDWTVAIADTGLEIGPAVDDDKGPFEIAVRRVRPETLREGTNILLSRVTSYETTPHLIVAYTRDGSAYTIDRQHIYKTSSLSFEPSPLLSTTSVSRNAIVPRQSYRERLIVIGLFLVLMGWWRGCSRGTLVFGSHVSCSGGSRLSARNA